MFSLPKKNIKILIIGLMISPTVNNCSSYLPSDKTVISENIPTMALIAGASIAAGICIGEKNIELIENDKLTLGLSLLSVAGGCFAYKYLTSFTPTNKIKAINDLLDKNKNKTEKNLWLNVFESEPISNDHLFGNIKKKYPAHDYPNVAFFKSDLEKLCSNVQKAEKIVARTIKHLNETTKKTEKTNLDSNKKMQELLTLQSVINQELEKLTAISQIIRNTENFNDHLEKFNKKQDQQKKHPALEEKTKILKSKNSYLNSLFSNQLFLQNFLALAFSLTSYIISKFTGQTEETA